MLERAVPRQIGVDEFIAEHEADVLLITPLIELGSPQLDYMRAARALGIRSALCVWSWDHLSSKALIRVVPDKVIVWNDTQRDEAQRFHGIPADRVVVTGAQCFDQWFDRAPARDRDDVLPPRRVSPARGRFCCMSVRRCSGAARRRRRSCCDGSRASGNRAMSACAICRSSSGRTRSARRNGRRICSPNCRASRMSCSGVPVPLMQESRADYFDSMFHAAAVVGLNTSALVESAIVDRPVFTILLPEFRDSQEGTFHFHYLLDSAHGFLNTSRSLDEHAQQLAGLLSGGTVRSNRRFRRALRQAAGAAVAATPVFADASSGSRVIRRRDRRASEAWLLLLRPVIYALVLAGRVPLVERIYWNPKKLLVRHS